MKRFSLALALTTLLVQAARAAETLNYNFTTASPTAQPASAIGGALVRINNNDPASPTTPFPFLDSGSPSSGYTGATGANNGGLAVKKGTLTAATYTGIELTITPRANNVLYVTGLKFGVRRTATGAQSYALFDSNAADAVPLVTGTVPDVNLWTLKTHTGFQSVAFGGPSPVAKKFYLLFYDVTGDPAPNTLSTRVDDLSLTLDVPEPTGLSLLSLAALALLRRPCRASETSPRPL